MKRALAIALLILLALSACGNRVKPIDLHDPLVPLDSRRLIADAQDAVAIARARLDEAQHELAEMTAWRGDMLDERRWEKVPDAAIDKLETFADARVRLAELSLEKAQREVALAQAKYRLVTAETAMRHDLAVYELEPLREDVESVRDGISEVSSQIADQRVALEKATQIWWRTYADIAGEGAASTAMYVDLRGEEELEREAEEQAREEEEKEREKEKQAAEEESDEIELDL